MSKNIRDLPGFFKMLGDPTRVRVISTLSKGERNVSDLCKELEILPMALSHHLSLMKFNFVVAERRKHHVFYKLSPTGEKAAALLDVLVG